jgi:hypothetical protein
MAGFFLAPGDRRRPGARRRFVDLIRDADRVGPKHLTPVPYPGWPLPAYRFAMPDKATGCPRREADVGADHRDGAQRTTDAPDAAAPPAVVPEAVQCA